MGSFAAGFAGGFADSSRKAAADKKKQKSGETSADPPSYKRGGKVRKTGKAKVHKGERVLTKAQARKYDRGK